MSDTWTDDELRRAGAAAALDVILSDDDVRALEEHYTPRQPTGY